MTEKIIEIRTMITDNVRYLDYSDYERRLQIIEMRGRLLELRYNHNHDEKGRFCSGSGGGRMSSSSDKRLYSNSGANPNKSIDKSKKNKFSLTKFLNDATIKDKKTEFKKHLANGDVNTTIEASKQQNHQVSKAWKNLVKQAVASNGRFTPKSVLDKSIDPQAFVNKYAGTGRIDIPKSGTSVHEYVTILGTVGRTFDKKVGKYVETNVMQIKYTDNGIHIFPTIERR